MAELISYPLAVPKPPSRLGRISLAIGIVVWAMLTGVFGAFVYYEYQDLDLLAEYPLWLTMADWILPALVIVGFVCGVLAVRNRTQRRTAAVIGLALNGVLFSIGLVGWVAGYFIDFDA